MEEQPVKHEKYLLQPQDSILTAVKRMDEINSKLLVVQVDGYYRSLLSIGDVQRAIIRGRDMQEPVENIFRDPKKIRVASTEDSMESIRQAIFDFRMEFMPVMEPDGKIANLIFWEELFQGKSRIAKSNLDVPVVVMAGGMGTRLKPITNIIPKALVPLDEKPIVELIMNRFADMGTRQFYMTVNYKAEMLESFFEGKDVQYKIDFVSEKEPLGTAGSLSLLRDRLKETFFVTNCDILIDDDYSAMYDFHKRNGNELTIIAALKHYRIPYGILETGEGGALMDVQEKPEFTYQVNSGMYILEPHLLDEIPDNEFFHITHLMEKVLARKGRAAVFPVSEGSWMDIGEWSEYNKTRDLLTKKRQPFI